MAVLVMTDLSKILNRVNCIEANSTSVQRKSCLVRGCPIIWITILPCRLRPSCQLTLRDVTRDVTHLASSSAVFCFWCLLINYVEHVVPQEEICLSVNCTRYHSLIIIQCVVQRRHLTPSLLIRKVFCKPRTSTPRYWTATTSPSVEDRRMGRRSLHNNNVYKPIQLSTFVLHEFNFV